MGSDAAAPSTPAADPRPAAPATVSTHGQTGPSELASWTCIAGGVLFAAALLSLALHAGGYLYLMATGGMLTAFGLGLWGESL